jgi:hypothetical protein
VWHQQWLVNLNDFSFEVSDVVVGSVCCVILCYVVKAVDMIVIVAFSVFCWVVVTELD